MLGNVQDVIKQLVSWHRGIRSAGLKEKLRRLCLSPFRFYRGTFFLFAAQMEKADLLDVTGPVVGDIHGENFGAYRAIHGEIVYDIDDFDEAAVGRYEQDVIRLALSAMLCGLEQGRRFADGVGLAETALYEYLQALEQWKGTNRAEFAAMEAAHPIRQLLAAAREKSRVTFLGKFIRHTHGEFRFQRTGEFTPARERMGAVERAVPELMKHCLAPANAELGRYRLLDVAARSSGTGSLGRDRLALLFDKGEREEASWRTLRLIEMKEAWVSGLESKRPARAAERGREVFEAFRRFQLHPKRYVGYTKLGGVSMQTREIGANDRRFRFENDPKGQMLLDKATPLQAAILARAHLLGAPGKKGPRELLRRIWGKQDRRVQQLLALIAELAERATADHEVLLRHQEELERLWIQQTRRV